MQFSREGSRASAEYDAFLGCFLRESPVVARRGDPTVADLLFGDPHDPPLPGIAKALHAQVEATASAGYRYVHHLPEAREAATQALSQRTDLPFEADDIFLNTGAFSGLSLCLRAFCGPGTEVVYLSPPWFYYRSMIKSVGAVPRSVGLNPDGWTLPLDDLAAAIGSQTSAVMVNSPHNPSGRVFSDEEFAGLGEVLSEVSRRLGRHIPIISDEAYARVVYGRTHAPTPARHYAATVVVYTYGKTLLAPSLRLGYMALAPGFPDAVRMRHMFDALQPIGGWLLPSGLVQRALPDLENLCIELTPLEQRRDRLCVALREGGYSVTPAQGTFYMLVGSPDPDDEAFSRYLEGRDVLVLPGSTMEAPGTFRVSLTASDTMIDQACSFFRSGR
ncbi:MAG: aminotransferase class I/II-fold pyridoxal phosphate-dependent enzyme [Pyrinomonadaceae bacterium]